MADLKISELTAATVVGGSEELPFALSGNNGKITTDQIKAHALSGLSVGENNTASNSGNDTIGGGVFKEKSGVDLVFNRIVGGSNVTISGGNASGGDITITGGGGGGGASDFVSLDDIDFSGATVDGGAYALLYDSLSGGYEDQLLGSAALADSTDFATSAQGGLADTALQPADVGTMAAEDAGDYYTASATDTLLGAKLDANTPITGATKTKITYDADGLVTSGADATTADIADSSNKRYVTDAQQTIIAATTASFTTAQSTKLGHITVTQAVDLDAIETRVNALDAAVVLKGTWDASGGSFPGSGTAQAGESWIVSVGGTVDSVVFVANDRILALTDNASTSTYAANWHKLDYTDQVLSVNGQTGAVMLDADDIDDTSTANKFTTSSDISKLAGIEAGADVTDTTNVTAAGALMDSEVTSLSGIKSLTVPDNTTISTFTKDLLDNTSAGAWQTDLALVPGANVQAYDVELAAIAGVTSAADKVPYFTGLGTAAVADLPSFGRTLIANTSAADARSDLVAATTSQTDACFSGFIETVADKTYKLVVKAPHGGTITETTTVSGSGTCTATFKINTTALGGTANSVSSSEQSQSQASANVFSAGDDIQLTVSGNSSCTDMSFTIKYTRTLS